MFCDACTDCYILYRVRQYLIAFWGIFIFVGCVAFGAVFADLCNKKRNSQKKSNCFSSILLHRGYNPNHPHKLQKAAVSQSDSPTQRPFRFWLRLTASVHRRPYVPDGHRLHDAAAVGGTVAGFFVHMKAGQAHKILCSSCTRSPITMGLDKKPFIPLSNALRRSSSNALAVMARIGSFARAGSSSARIVRVAV